MSKGNNERGESLPQLLAKLRSDQRSEVDLKEGLQLYERGFGEVEGNVLVLTPQETLFLLEKGRLRVIDELGNEQTFESLLNRYSSNIDSFLILYIIYRDLRRKGYQVKPGFGSDLVYRVYEKGRRDTAKYVIYPLFEGRACLTEDLLVAAKQVMSKGKVFLIAVVERRGEVIYYQCTAAAPVKA